jgi:hypothetical protein
MRQAICLIVLVLLLCVNVSSALAAPIAQSTTAWTGYYFANPNLQGNPALVRDDPNIDFTWGNASPASGIPADNFSVRWIRWLYLDAPGRWTFVVTADDGARLFIDEQLVIDAWQDQQTTTRSVTLNLTQAFHLVRMEYYDHIGNAEAHLQILSANFPDWRGEYFDNPNLSGAAIFTRNDSTINFNFGTAGPGGGIAAEKFSARWTRNVYLGAGHYRFVTRTHDGVRLWVDNQLVIDRWRDQRTTTWNGESVLADGDHFIKMEYYTNSSGGVASLTWSPVSGGMEVWHGEYFDNAGLSGSLALGRDDSAINFNWGTGSPGTGISGGNWSARWTMKRATTLPSYYTVTATADDGVRVWADNNLLIDEWHDQSPTPHAAMVYLNAGAHDWRVEYYNHGGSATVAVQITPGAVSPDVQTSAAPVTGDIAIDTMSSNFIKSGADDAWRTAPNGYGGTAFAVKNNAFADTQSGWVRWYAPLPRPGYYDVSVYIPANLGTTRSARYWIAHAGAYDFRALNQSLYTNQWVGLGVYFFSAMDDEYVALSDVTYEPFAATTLVVDAVRFSAR